MSLQEKIEADMKAAMKSGDSLRAGTMKMLKSDLMYEKARTGQEIGEEKALEVVTRASKKRKEAMEEYRRAGRDDLADKEAAELAIIQEFLPEMLSEAEVEKIIDQTIAAMGGVTKKDFGKVMGAAMKELKGRADGAVVKDILNRKLQ
jgi:uncharacterized protein YqeY